MRIHKKILALLLLSSLSILGCGKKDSDDDSGSSDTEEDSDDPAATNSLASAYPTQLAISVFPSDEATALYLAGEVDDPMLGKKPEELIDENKDILSGAADNCIDMRLFKPFKEMDEITCYEFDSDMNPAKFADRPGKEWGTIDGTNDGGEACMVAFTRKEVQTSQALVNKALALIKGMICQGKKEDTDVEMPEAGEELDLVDAMEAATGGKMPVVEAKIEAIEGTGLADEDETIYQSTIILEDLDGNEMSVFLTNQKTDDGEKGILSFKRPGRAAVADLENDMNNSENKIEAMSISYEFDGDLAKIDVRRAAILDTIEPFNDDGFVNFEGIPENATNTTVHMMNYVGFEINPETSEGKFAYWMNPGGSYNEAARGFVYNVEADDDGNLSGCGISGATSNVSIRKHFTDDSFELEPTGWWHPRYGQNTHAQKDARYNASTGTKVTMQCFEQDADGVYQVSTDDARGYELVLPADAGIDAPGAPTAQLPPPPKDFDK